MTHLLETALKRLNQLSEADQDRYAAKILQELNAEFSAPREETDTPTPTAHALAKRFAGILKGGPSDLATNPAYMEGFGEGSMQ